ncbi:orotidine 5'-phosphate decarboxylase [Clostridia bacterium]|nr:orotidine 5'-phosphate decarboxylase [Clostridia bacterium]
MNMDKLYDNVSTKGIVCLGLDTSAAYLPEHILTKGGDPAEAILQFNRAIIDATRDVVACYKVQIAYYEALGLRGMSTFARTLKYIKDAGQLVITDCKRGDIKESAEMYAKAHFSGDFETDFVTVNPYMGMDTLEPYEPYFAAGKGCFVLMRTSNAGAKDFQYLDVNDRKIYEIVGEKLQKFGERYIGARGYSAVGAVMGATNVEEIRKLRKMLGTTFLLIPGFGAQGGKAEDAAQFLKDGNGGVVNSSRGILTAWKKAENGENCFAECARAEAIAMNNAILGKTA